MAIEDLTSATTPPANADPPENNADEGDDDPSDDEILAELDAELNPDDDDDEDDDKKKSSKGKPKDKAKGKDKPKERPKDKDDETDDDDSDDEDDDEEEPERKSKTKDKRSAKDDDEDEESDDDDDSDDDEDDDDRRDKRRPTLSPETPAEVRKFFNEKWREFREAADKADEERATQAAAHTKLENDHKENVEKFNSWIRNTLRPKIEPAVTILLAIEKYTEGDMESFRTAWEAVTKESLDVSMKKVLHGTKESHGNSKVRALLVEQAQQLKALKEQLDAKKVEETKQAKKLTVQRETKKYMRHIAGELEDHPVAKFPEFANKVYAVQRKSFDPKLKGFKLSIEEAANKVLRVERRRFKALRRALGDEETQPTERREKRLPAPKDEDRVFSLNRSDSREGGAIDDDDESDEEILRDLDRQFAKKRRADAKAERERDTKKKKGTRR